jgi:hypothetical protein
VKLAKALLGAAVAGIALAGSTATRAEPPVYVTLKESLGPPCCYGPQVFYVFSVTNDLGGANKIYQFEAFLGGVVIDLSAPTGFDVDESGTVWTDDDYNSAIAPGGTGYFYTLGYNDFIIPSIYWSVSVEGGPNGEATVFYSGVALANVPESSTWAMMLLGFAGLGFAGYRAARKGVSLAA